MTSDLCNESVLTRMVIDLCGHFTSPVTISPLLCLEFIQVLTIVLISFQFISDFSDMVVNWLSIVIT